MEEIFQVNARFLRWDADAGKLLAALSLMYLRGKTISLLSEAAKRRLSSFTNHSRDAFLAGLASYLVTLVLVSPLNVLLNEVLRRLRLVWSNRLTRVLVKQMLDKRANNGNGGVGKDFETMVANDADKFVELEIDLAREALEAVSHLYFFTQILWAQSPSLAKAAMACAALTTALSLKFGTARLSLLFAQEREAEAMFAHTLSTVRENMEGIQFARGSGFETARLGALDLARQQAAMTRKREKDVVSYACTLLRQVASGFLPAWYLRSEEECEDEEHHHHGHLHRNATHGHAHALSPQPEHGHGHKHNGDGEKEQDVAHQVAVLVQTTEAFDEMLFHLLIVTENFHSVIRLVAIAHDICTLLKTGEAAEQALALNGGMRYTTDADEHWLVAESLSISLPATTSNGNGSSPARDLLVDFNCALPKGQSLLITGPSGCGKTSVLRVLFGLWDAKPGSKIARPKDLFCVAQKPYLCLNGTLKEQACFPSPATRFSDAQVLEALQSVGLSHVCEHLNDTGRRNWQLELSMGEQQRISFARILLHEYRYVFLDESTSSCDLATEAKLYQLLLARNVSFVSVGHRQSIEKFHLHKIELFGSTGNNGGNLAAGGWKQVF